MPRWIALVLALGLLPRGSLSALPPVPPPTVRSDAELLGAIQRSGFEYFWNEAHPETGLVRDRSTPGSKCSIAATGFGLSVLAVAVQRGWLDRSEARERTVRTLRTFERGPQGPAPEGVIGYRGWFYHFLEMETSVRAWRCELSSIDTALLLAGALDASRFFDGSHPLEEEIRQLAERLLERVDWEWMRNGGDSLTMGWHPESGFIRARWVGYNEAMILYLLALGAVTRPLPESAWDAWTAGYKWVPEGVEGGHVAFAPLFGHQYSHVWVDFRGIADPWMAARGTDYFRNSRRAVLAQQAYAVANPLGHPGYGTRVWGLTACDGPGGPGFHTYSARGCPPGFNDDGTLAPTAVGASVPFAPELCLPALHEMHSRWGTRLWTRYGFRDAFNLRAGWFDPDVLGIDQGPMVLMLENHRSGAVWRRMMGHPVIRRGLARAGFRPLP